MSSKKSIFVKLIKPKNLTLDQISQMADIYLSHHYIDRTSCEARLTSGFDLLAVFYSKSEKRIIGFNGMRLRTHKVEGFWQPIKSLYLGQMFVEPAYRGSHPIHKACLKALFPYKILQPWYKLIIWGDALTYKPYLLIAGTANKFFPNPEQETPEAYQNLICHLGTSNYKDKFIPETGCVVKDKLLIKEDIAPIHPRLLKNSLIRFYAEKNVNHMKGHGLLVMMDFSWGAAKNIVRKITKKRVRKLKKQFQTLPFFKEVVA